MPGLTNEEAFEIMVRVSDELKEAAIRCETVAGRTALAAAGEATCRLTAGLDAVIRRRPITSLL